jgi:hypothetical protein
MAEPLCKVAWYCKHCRGRGTAELWAALCDRGRVDVIVRAHSLTCPNCDADPRVSLRCGPPTRI